MSQSPPALGLEDRFPALKGSVFVVTYGRSGSTLIQNLLNALPGYTNRGENENLIAPLVRAWDTVLTSEQRANMTATTRTDPWFGYEAVDAERFGAALAASFIETVLRPDPGTCVIGFKEIRWHGDPALFPVMLDFLRIFFPRARFVFNIRDHDQVVRSGWWKWMNPDAVKRQLTGAEALYRAYAGRHPSISHETRYDQLVTGPEAWRPLLEFLGEPFDADLVREVLNHRLTHLKSG